MRLTVVSILTLGCLAFAPQETPDARAKRVVSDPRFVQAMAAIDRDHDRLVSEIVTLTEIPAPPFKEDARAAAYLEMLRTSGLSAVERDERGFVLTGRDLLRAGRPPQGWPLDRPPLLLETSLPGVFAAGDVRHGSVKRVASAVGDGAQVVAAIHAYLAKPAEPVAAAVPEMIVTPL